jgi:hypothetical protein
MQMNATSGQQPHAQQIMNARMVYAAAALDAGIKLPAACCQHIKTFPSVVWVVLTAARAVPINVV